MLDQLLKNLGPNLGLEHFSYIVEDIVRILAKIDNAWVKDANNRDAVIDAICQILQSEKSNQGKP